MSFSPVQVRDDVRRFQTGPGDRPAYRRFSYGARGGKRTCFPINPGLGMARIGYGLYVRESRATAGSAPRGGSDRSLMGMSMTKRPALPPQAPYRFTARAIANGSNSSKNLRKAARQESSVEQNRTEVMARAIACDEPGPANYGNRGDRRIAPAGRGARPSVTRPAGAAAQAVMSAAAPAFQTIK